MPLTAIPRYAYFAQSGTIQSTYTGTNYTGSVYVFPISTANIEVSRPIEGVNTFGHFGSLNTAQTNLTTCKSTLKGYMGSGSGGLSGLNTAAILDLINNTTSGNQIAISVSPGGWTMSGILSNLGLEIALGSFGMFDLGFAGVGEPVLTNPLTAPSAVTISPNAYTISPITTFSVGAGPAGTGVLSGSYPTSIKISYDLPTDILGSLGDFPDAVQGSFYPNTGPLSGIPMIISQMATKPPYKSTVQVEGYGVNPTILDSNVASGWYAIGNVACTLPHAKVASRGISNAAGQISETFSYGLEDFSINFEDISLLAYSQSPTGAPSWGG